jgi:hypothetical protein
MPKKQSEQTAMKSLEFPFVTKIAGISRHQKELEKVRGYGSFFILVREPGNTFDKNAIKVMAYGNLDLGYIPKYTAELLAPLLDSGFASRRATFVRANFSTKVENANKGLTIKIWEHGKGPHTGKKPDR